jgi:hypothetical protein
LDSTLIKILKGKRKKKRSCKYGEIFFVDIKNQTDRALKSKSKPNFLQKKKKSKPNPTSEWVMQDWVSLGSPKL